VNYPTIDEEKEIMSRMASLAPMPEVEPILTGTEILEVRKIVDAIYIDDKIIDYILNIVFATRDPKKYGIDIENLLVYGASPRASIALKNAAKAHAFLSGRAYVTPHDVKEIACDVLRHRLRRSYEAEAENIMADEIIDKILSTVLVP